MSVFPIGAIAAAAAKSTRDNEFSGIASDLYKSTTVYGNLIINKYYKFQEMKYASFTEKLPRIPCNIRTTTIASEILLFSKEFPIEIDLTKTNLDTGIKEATEKYSADKYWEQEDQEILEKYINHVGVQYAINISADKVKYSVEFHPYKFMPN
jgi:hypothetical protein